MENHNIFISSRGILKSCNFHSQNPYSSCNGDIGYLNEMINSSRMFDGMSIYVCSDLLRFFVSQILPKIKHKFNLVTGDSDLCVPKEALCESETRTLTNNLYLTKWFAQNTEIQNNDMIIQLPIGLDYHTISNNQNHSWSDLGEGSFPKDQEDILISLRQQMKPFFERVPLIYINFSINNDKFLQRKNAFEQIPNNLLFINQTFSKRTVVWKNIINYTFVLSPFGMGMDCHRTWETLCLGAIPIVKAPKFKKMFEDLPVLIVDDWSEITRELLDETINNFKNKTFDYEKLKLNFWIDKINK